MLPGVGLSEILVIALVVLLVVKPRDVPVIMRKAGIFTAYIRHFLQGIWAGWQEDLPNFPVNKKR